mmetsp:Transcript_24826/g.53798  ORF Transcript_24826/g.53798 Transcript_24826/m.53798 type:complete len:120 (-) Transcript_24826:176-535(-)
MALVLLGVSQLPTQSLADKAIQSGLPLHGLLEWTQFVLMISPAVVFGVFYPVHLRNWWLERKGKGRNVQLLDGVSHAEPQTNVIEKGNPSSAPNGDLGVSKNCVQNEPRQADTELVVFC